jgi:hypothetical protein
LAVLVHTPPIDYDVGVVSKPNVYVALFSQVIILICGELKNRSLRVVFGTVLACILLGSMAIPVTALVPHEDPDAVTPTFDSVSFLLFFSEFLGQITSNGTFEPNDFIDRMGSMNLPDNLHQTTTHMVSDVISFYSNNAELQALRHQLQVSILRSEFETVKDLASQGFEITSQLHVLPDTLIKDIIYVANNSLLLKNTSETELSQLLEPIQRRVAGLHEYLDQQDTLLAFYVRESEILVGLELPNLELSVLPDTAYVGDDIGFQGDLTLNGTPIASRSIILQADGTNITTATTDETGHYKGTLTIPERYGEYLMLQAIYLPSEADALNHLPAFSQEIPVSTLFHTVSLNLSRDEVVYPGRALKLGIELDYAGAPPVADRPFEIYLDNALVTSSVITLSAPEILIGIDPEAIVGSHRLTVVLPPTGRYAPEDRTEIIDIQRAPLTLDLERPTLAFLPGSVRYRGHVTSEIGPASGANVTLEMGGNKVTTLTDSEGGFGAEFEIGFAGGLVGRQPISVQVIPEQPWHKRLSETRRQVVVNLVNCILLGFFVLVIGVYLPTRIDFRALRRNRVTRVLGMIPPVPEPTPVPLVKWVDKSPPKALPERVIYWYQRALFFIQRLTGMSPRAGQTLREFALAASRGLGPLARPFFELTHLVERLTYSPYRATEADADFGESLTRRIDESAATAGPGGEDAGA